MLSSITQRSLLASGALSRVLRSRHIPVFTSGVVRLLSTDEERNTKLSLGLEPAVGSSSISSLLASPTETISKSSTSAQTTEATAPKVPIEFGAFTSSIQSDFVQNSDNTTIQPPAVQRRLRFPDSAGVTPTFGSGDSNDSGMSSQNSNLRSSSRARSTDVTNESMASRRPARRRSRKGSATKPRRTPSPRKSRANLGNVLSPKLQLSCRACSQPIVSDPRKIDLLCTNGGYHLIAKDWQMPQTYGYESLIASESSAEEDGPVVETSKDKFYHNKHHATGTSSQQVESWNRTAKITCPNCASYVGSQLAHDAGLRRGVLFKGACLQWTNTAKGWVSTSIPVWRSDFHFLLETLQRRRKGKKSKAKTTKVEDGPLELGGPDVVVQAVPSRLSRIGLGVLWQQRTQVKSISDVESKRARFYRELDAQQNATALLRAYCTHREEGGESLSMMNVCFAMNRFVDLANQEIRSVEVRAQKSDAEVLLNDVSTLLSTPMDKVLRRQTPFGFGEVLPRTEPNPLSFLPLGLLVDFANNVAAIHPDETTRKLALQFVGEELRYASNVLHVVLLPEAKSLLQKADKLVANGEALSDPTVRLRSATQTNKNEQPSIVDRFRALFDPSPPLQKSTTKQPVASSNHATGKVESLSTEQVTEVVSVGCNNHLLPAFQSSSNQTGSNEPTVYGFGTSRDIGSHSKSSNSSKPGNQVSENQSGELPSQSKPKRRSTRRGGRRAVVESNSDPVSSSDKLYTSSIPPHRVYMVDSDEKLLLATQRFKQLIEAAKEVHQNTGVRSDNLAVACDAEWKPVFRKGQRIRCAIFQVSTRTETYVFDVLTLGNKLAPLLGELLSCDSVIKIGHSVREDLYVLAEATGLNANSESAEGKEDETPLAGPCVDVTQLAARKHGRHHSIGLKRLIWTVTGKQLKKNGVQMSNWEQRPLASDQIHYAAMDASCLFEVYDWYRFELGCEAQSKKSDIIGDGEAAAKDGAAFSESEYFLAYSFARNHQRGRRSKGIPYSEVEASRK